MLKNNLVLGDGGRKKGRSWQELLGRAELLQEGQIIGVTRLKGEAQRAWGERGLQ